MPKSLLRVPYTGPLPPPVIHPRNANTATGAIQALLNFLNAAPSPRLKHANPHNDQTVILTGAGISVASGLADYRGTSGTYTLNRTYRPIYYNEFCENHEARKRYWARSFLGWPNTHNSKPNASHHAIGQLGRIGKVSSVITQNVDSFHPKAHPDLTTLELHGYLRNLVCLTCRQEYDREQFQTQLKELNPTWARFLQNALESGALSTEHPDERRRKGLKTNPDGDVDLPDAPYSTFRYPACPNCLSRPPTLKDGSLGKVEIDKDGAWVETNNAGVLKPAVVMFGESIAASVKEAAEQAVDGASRILVTGSSLATYSAWRLVKRAKEQGMPIGILNLGGARGEDSFFAELDAVANDGSLGYRASESAEKILPAIIQSAVEIASNPQADYQLKLQAVQYITQIRNDPTSWSIGLNFFVSGPEAAVWDVRFFGLEIVINAVASGRLDQHALLTIKDTLVAYVKKDFGVAREDKPHDNVPTINKLAQALTLLFTALYTDGWQSFFQDLQLLTQGELDHPDSSDKSGTFFYLRVLNSVHDEIADNLINTRPDRAKIHAKLKDQIRERDSDLIAASWQDILSRWQTLDPHLTQLCLTCMSRWVSWSDISFFVNERTVQRLLEIAGQQDTGHPESAASKTRDAAIGVFTETVAKKMPPTDKIKLIQFLNLGTVVDQLLATSPLHNRSSPDYDTDMAETVAKLVNNIVIDTVEALNSDSLDAETSQTAAELIQTSTPQILRFLADDYDEVCSTVIGALTEQLSLLRKIASAKQHLPPPYDGMLLPILNALVAKMRFDETADWGEEGEESDEAEFEELRKRLKIAQQNVAAINEPLYLETLSNYVESIFVQYRNDPSKVEWQDAEVALVELSMVGELAMRNSGLYQKKAPSSEGAQRFITTMAAMMDSNIASYNHPAVSMQYMEICYKYHSFFSHQKEYLPKALEDFARFIKDPEEKHRIRSWNIFARFVQRTRGEMGPYAATIIGAVQELLVVQAQVPGNDDSDDSDTGSQTLEDAKFVSQLSLFEAVGVLSGSVGLSEDHQESFVQSTLEPLLNGIQASTILASQNDEYHVIQVHHLFEATGTVARGYQDWIPGKAKSTTNTRVASQFEKAAAIILAALQKLSNLATIREAARYAFARLIGVLGVRILVQLPQWFEGILAGSSSRDEISNFLRLLGQAIYTFKGDLRDILDALYTPLLRRVWSTLESPTQGTDEVLQQNELRREYLAFLISILQQDSHLYEIMVSEANQPIFENVIQSIEYYAKDTSDTNDARLALSVLTRMCAIWGGPTIFQPSKAGMTNGGAANGAAPAPSLPTFDKFMIERFSDLTWKVMTNPQFNVKDPPANKALGEIAVVQQAILSKTGSAYVEWLQGTEMPKLGLQAGIIESYITALTTLDSKAFKQFLFRLLTEGQSG